MDKPMIPHRAVSAASDNNTLVKTGPCRLRHITVNNVNAAVRYLHLYDKATAPTAGTDTPVLTIPIPAGTSRDIPHGNGGFVFELGLGYSLTTSISGASGNVSANEHVVSLGYNEMA